MGIRLCFDFAKSAVKRLDKLMKFMDFPSRAETIRQALTFYERKVYEGEKHCSTCGCWTRKEKLLTTYGYCYMIDSKSCLFHLECPAEFKEFFVTREDFYCSHYEK